MSKLKFLDKLLSNKLFMILFSFIAAFLFWFIVVAIISPISTRTIDGVSVTVDEKSGFISTANLHLIENSTSKISVQVSGPRYIIGKLSSSDFIITPDLGPVIKSGIFNLKLIASMKKPDPEVRIVEISKPNIEVSFDTIVSKSLPIEIKMQNNSKVADGFIMQTASVSPKQVAVTGPSVEISGIVHAVVDVNIDGYANSTVTSKNPVMLYDGKNNVIDQKHIKIDYSSASVTIPILKTKTVPLAVDFNNIPSGFDKKNMTVVSNPVNISVAGNVQDIDALNTIKMQNIDFMSLDVTSTVNTSIILPKGITSVDNINSAAVSVKLLNTASVILITKNISLANAPIGYTIRVRSTQISNIKLFGPASEISAASAVVATIDMSTINVIEGTYEVPVTISVPGRTGYWVIGAYKANITVWQN